MSLKNLDLTGISLDTNGKPCFSKKVQNPKLNTPRSVGIVSTYSGKIAKENKDAVSEKQSNTVQTKSVPTRYKTTSSSAGGMSTMFGGNVSASSILPTTVYMGVLEGILGKDDWYTKHKIYRDIYTYDIAGAVVDIIATLPFSGFTLVGVDDSEVLKTYLDTIDDLNLPKMLPSITTDYLVMGAFVGSLGWDKSKNKFTTMVPQDLDYCEIYDMGISGVDPVIDAELPEHYRDILQHSGPRFERLKKQLPDYIVKASNSGKIELDPFYTLYVPRRGLTSMFSNSDQEAVSTAGTGNSYFNRILTIYLLEKALIKGTIESAQRRQRAITHITAGTDDWTPNDEELSTLSELFLAADLDPISAQVVTRNGVEANSVKSGDDFWKWNDIFDFTTGAKLQALGTNESILSADASFNTLDAALSLFMDSISQTRDIITQMVYYNKICPIIAYHNDFKKKSNTKTSIFSSAKKEGAPLVGRSTPFKVTSNIPEMENISDYIIPTIQYNKSLKPEADSDYLEILNTLEEKGIPIPLRIYAAAGGENIDQLINAMDDDNELRLEIAEKKKDLIDQAVKEKVEKLLGIEDIEDLLPEPDDIEAKLKTLGSMGSIDRTKKARNLEAQEERYGVREYDSNGHRRVLTQTRKKQLTDKIHKQTAEVLAHKAEEHNYKIKNGG